MCGARIVRLGPSIFRMRKFAQCIWRAVQVVAIAVQGTNVLDPGMASTDSPNLSSRTSSFSISSILSDNSSRKRAGPFPCDFTEKQPRVEASGSLVLSEQHGATGAYCVWFTLCYANSLSNHRSRRFPVPWQQFQHLSIQLQPASFSRS